MAVCIIFIGGEGGCNRLAFEHWVGKKREGAFEIYSLQWIMEDVIKYCYMHVCTVGYYSGYL